MVPFRLWLAAVLAESVQARILGSSFGIPGVNATFDYVVVGGGTAGLAIATRLVEQNAGSVAVVEAGTFYELSNGNASQVPGPGVNYAGKSALDWQPLIDWGYMTTPQPGANNASLHYARGKTLGGSSARNAMIYQRGTTASYQRWADQVGDASYTFEKFLPYFEKSINFSAPDLSVRFANSTPQYDQTVMGDGTGPLSVAFPNSPSVYGTFAAEGMKQINLSVIDGFQSGSLLGSSYNMFTIDSGTMLRSSSETSFMQQALQYDAYHVYHLTMAKKILFDSSKKATGVLVDTQGFQYTLNANKEVIVSAGAFASPQILQTSGVGPAEVLSPLGIDVIADRPGVGQRMQDHVWVTLAYPINAQTSSSLRYPSFLYGQQALFNNYPATGIYSSPNCDVLAWEKVPQDLRASWSNTTNGCLRAYPEDWPELEYMTVNSYVNEQEIYKLMDPFDGTNYASMGVILASPVSRGSVTITSADTSVHPSIDPGWLTSQADMDVMVAGVKRAREFWGTSALQGLVIGEEKFPGAEVSTDAEIESFIRSAFNTIWHAACTCEMGKIDDPNAVVDSEAKVIGVQGLRVVDASAFPLLPPGHPQSTVYALAEKIACNISGAC
ncbi:putative glucose-methanol-choline oxidoreductase [Diaporthe sp. PMI_573]|nr:putative glucose-methanol-choline oxidoreductase [Diaporthaceae sp. PMI_573]